MRIAYQFHQLDSKAKELATKSNKGILLSSLLFNANGSLYKNSTTIQL